MRRVVSLFSHCEKNLATDRHWRIAMKGLLYLLGFINFPFFSFWQ